jgi:polysaccharide biosynthesis/export protein
MKGVSRESGLGKRVSAAVILSSIALMAAASLASAQTAKSKAASGAFSGESLPGNAVIPASPTYIIRPADVLDINVWQQTDLSFKGLPVRPDGKISLPLINDVQAAGSTAMQLAATITQRLKQYVKDPVVTVVVSEVNSQRYYVLGEVLHAGVFPLLPGLTALQALSAAGGFSQFANTKKIYVLRTVNGKQEKFPFNYKAVINGRDLKDNIHLRPGDTIIVP